MGGSYTEARLSILGGLISTAAGTPLKLRLVDKQLQVKKELVYDGKVTWPRKLDRQKSQQ